MDIQNITIHDKNFEPFILFEEIDQAVGNIADRMNKDLKDKNPLFLVILNGSFMFAADLFKKLAFPCEISFIKLASYEGTESSQNVRELIGFDEEIKGRAIVVVEDIIDSGVTLQEVLPRLKELGASDIKIASLLFKPNAFKGNYPVDYVGMQIPNDFIVGYGLDYNKHGRNYKDIYKIIE